MLIPDKAPHEEIDLTGVEEKLKKSNALMARYTANFDCGYETQWWYVIKDDKMDLTQIKSKYRREVISGINNTNVKIINKEIYYNEMFELFSIVMGQRPQHKGKDMEVIFNNSLIQSNKNIDIWGVFLKESDKLVSYAVIDKYEEYVSFSEFFFNDAYLKYKISNALVYTLSKYYLNDESKRYVCDGERSINHPTNIQSYLIRTFGFRKAYCELRVIYRNRFIHLIVRVLYLFKSLIFKFKDMSVFSRNLYSLLKQEEIQRSFN